MSISPIITFRAGLCALDASPSLLLTETIVADTRKQTTESPSKVIPKPAPGYLYLYEEDELIHFCWRPRSALMSEPELDLVMVPSDGVFKPYTGPGSNSASSTKSPTNGRIFVLKFSSSTQRHLFWLQSKSQHAQGDPSWFSPRDLKIGSIVNSLLQGEEVNVQEEVANISNGPGDGGDETMEDAAPEGHGDIQGSLGTGDPFIGDPGEEGEEAREGGADGGRA